MSKAAPINRKASNQSLIRHGQLIRPGQTETQQVSLRSLAHDLAARFRACPVSCEEEAIEAIVLTGSVAEGYADHYSDLDFYIVHRSRVSLETVMALYRAAGFWSISQPGMLKPPVNGGLLGDDGLYASNTYFFGIVRCELTQITTAFFEQQFATVLKDYNAGNSAQGFVASIPTAVPLYNEAFLSDWKGAAANYPQEMADAMVKHYSLRLHPRYLLFGMAKRPGDELCFRDRIIWQAECLLGILSGLNHLYFWAGSRKRRDRLIARMRIAPRDLASRWRAFLDADALASCRLIDDLIRDTFVLVSENMPQMNADGDYAWDRYAVDMRFRKLG